MIFSQALDDIKQGHELLLPELTKRKAKHEAWQGVAATCPNVLPYQVRVYTWHWSMGRVICRLLEEDASQFLLF